MPERLIDLLFRRLSQRARTQEFSELTDEEAQRVEAIYSQSFETAALLREGTRSS